MRDSVMRGEPEETEGTGLENLVEEYLRTEQLDDAKARTVQRLLRKDAAATALEVILEENHSNVRVRSGAPSE